MGPGARPALAGRLSAALHLYAYRGLVDEPLRWAELTIPLVSDEDPTRPVLLASAATRAINRGDLEEARAIAQRAVALAGSRPAAMPALEALGDACLYLGRLDESRAAAEELARRAEAAGDMHCYVLGRVNAALAPRYGGQAIGPEAIADLPARLSDPSPTSRAWIAYTSGELIGDRAPDTALAHYQEAIRLARSVDSRFAEGVALVSACALQARAGDVPGALSQFAEVIDHWAQLADNTHQLTTLRNLAVLLRRAGAPRGRSRVAGRARARTTRPTGKKQNGSKRCASGHGRSSVTKCSPRTSTPAGSAMSPPQRSGPSTCSHNFGADVNVSRGRPLRGGRTRQRRVQIDVSVPGSVFAYPADRHPLDGADV